MARLPLIGALLIAGVTLWLALFHADPGLTISGTVGYVWAAHQRAELRGEFERSVVAHAG